MKGILSVVMLLVIAVGVLAIVGVANGVFQRLKETGNQQEERPLPARGCGIAFYVVLLLMGVVLMIGYVHYRNTPQGNDSESLSKNNYRID